MSDQSDRVWRAIMVVLVGWAITCIIVIAVLGLIAYMVLR